MEILPGRRRATRLLWALGLLLLGAARGEASFHTDVPARTWRALALEKLPQGAVVRAVVRASHPLDVAFVRKPDLAVYPNGAPPVFRGRVEDELQFTVIAPEEGDYALVLDNRSGQQQATVDLRVEAARADAPQRGLPPGASMQPPAPPGTAHHGTVEHDGVVRDDGARLDHHVAAEPHPLPDPRPLAHDRLLAHYRLVAD